jgi:hypothetical protein
MSKIKRSMLALALTFGFAATILIATPFQASAHWRHHHHHHHIHAGIVLHL